MPRERISSAQRSCSSARPVCTISCSLTLSSTPVSLILALCAMTATAAFALSKLPSNTPEAISAKTLSISAKRAMPERFLPPLAFPSLRLCAVCVECAQHLPSEYLESRPQRSPFFFVAPHLAMRLTPFDRGLPGGPEQIRRFGSSKPFPGTPFPYLVGSFSLYRPSSM